MWNNRPRFPKPSAGDYFCSATAAVLPLKLLEIKGLAGQTPPASCGAQAAPFPQFLAAGKHAGIPFVSYLPK
jgi:hypothetical protein